MDNCQNSHLDKKECTNLAFRVDHRVDLKLNYQPETSSHERKAVQTYDAKARSDARCKEVHRKCLTQVQRGRTFCMASANRIASERAVVVIAGVMSVPNLAKEGQPSTRAREARKATTS